MSRADAAAEPSMDEILASIRKIIAEEPIGSRPIDARNQGPTPPLAPRTGIAGAQVPKPDALPSRLADALRTTEPGSVGTERNGAGTAAADDEDDLSDLLEDGRAPGSPAAVHWPSASPLLQRSAPPARAAAAPALAPVVPRPSSAPAGSLPRESDRAISSGHLLPDLGSVRPDPQQDRSALPVADKTKSNSTEPSAKQSDPTPPGTAAEPKARVGQRPALESKTASDAAATALSALGALAAGLASATGSGAAARDGGSKAAQPAQYDVDKAAAAPAPPSASTDASHTDLPSATRATDIGQTRAPAGNAETPASRAASEANSAATAAEPESGVTAANVGRAAGEPDGQPVTAAKLAESARSLEDAVSDLLRPMLRDWLDANMPRIVEKALRSEMAVKPKEKT